MNLPRRRGSGRMRPPPLCGSGCRPARRRFLGRYSGPEVNESNACASTIKHRCMWVDFLGKSMSQQQVFSFAFIFKCRNSTAATLAHRVPACMNFHSHMKRRAIPPKAAAAVAANGISPWSPSYLFWPQGISFFRPSFARLSGRDTTVRTAEKKRSTTEGRPGRPHARPRRRHERLLVVD